MADVLHSPAVNLSRKSEKSYDITILVSSARRDPHLCPVGRGKLSRPHKFADVYATLLVGSKEGPAGGIIMLLGVKRREFIALVGGAAMSTA